MGERYKSLEFCDRFLRLLDQKRLVKTITGYGAIYRVPRLLLDRCCSLEMGVADLTLTPFMFLAGTNDSYANIKVNQHTENAQRTLDEVIRGFGSNSCYMRQLVFKTANFDS